MNKLSLTAIRYKQAINFAGYQTRKTPYAIGMAAMAACLAAIFLSMVLVSSAEARLVSMKKYATGITRIHNKYRNMETAANMQMMIWDKTLARRAAEWSENCYWGHQKRGLGENLAYQWSTGPLKPSEVIIKAIKGWYNEKYVWRWSTQCGAACHYTQINGDRRRWLDRGILTKVLDIGRNESVHPAKSCVKK